MPYPRIREAPESSSAATLQAVAAALSNAWFQPQRGTPNQIRLARWAARLPNGLIRRLVARNVRENALDPALTRYISSEGLARQALDVYKRVQNGIGYPAIMIGAPNGGVAYLAALLHIPFLPAHFLLSFHDPTPPDATAVYQAHGSRLIEPIIERNPNLLAVNHFDPLHDRFLVEQSNHVRLKFLDLPEAYRTFIRDHLAPNGLLLFTDCNYSWEQYEIGDQHYFQVGGLGGYTETDYLEGNSEIDAWLQAQGSDHRGGWQLPDYSTLFAPESEWGSLPAFREAVHDFAGTNRFRFRTLNGGHPEDFSALAYTAYLWEARLHERTPAGILIDSFNQISPTAALRANLLPLWLPFNCDDSLQFLARMAPYFPADTPILLSLLTTITRTPDVPGALAWKQIAGKKGDVSWIGTNPARFPVDLASRFNYLPQLQAWTGERPGQEPQPQLTPEDLHQMIYFLSQDGPRLLNDLLYVEANEADEPQEPAPPSSFIPDLEPESDPPLPPEA